MAESELTEDELKFYMAYAKRLMEDALAAEESGISAPGSAGTEQAMYAAMTRVSKKQVDDGETTHAAERLSKRLTEAAKKETDKDREEGFMDLARRARTNEFDTFSPKHDFPQLKLVEELEVLGGEEAKSVIDEVKHKIYE